MKRRNISVALWGSRAEREPRDLKTLTVKEFFASLLAAGAADPNGAVWSPVSFRSEDLKSLEDGTQPEHLRPNVSALVVDMPGGEAIVGGEAPVPPPVDGEARGEDGPDLPDAVRLWSPWAFVAHDTRSGLRVVLPLARDVSSEEHRALHRWAEMRMCDAAVRVPPHGRHPGTRWTSPAGMESTRHAGPLLDPDFVLPLFEASKTQDFLGAQPHGSQHVEGTFAVAVGLDVETWARMSRPGEVADIDGSTLFRHRTGVAVVRSGESKWWSDPAEGFRARSPDVTALARMGWNISKDGVKKWPPRSNVTNFRLALYHDRSLPLWWDEFREAVMLGDEQVNNVQDARIASWCEVHYGLEGNQGQLRAAYLSVAKARSRNDLLTYLRGCSAGDTGEDVLEEWAIRGMGGYDNEITRFFSRAWLIQAAARALWPGCKADSVICFPGRQGMGKSEALNMLVGGTLKAPSGWHGAERIDHPGSKQAGEKIRSKWVWEVAEMEGMNSGDIARWKAWITRRSDRYRDPWALVASDKPRVTVFAATTNDPEFLRDDENRRFWIVPVERKCDWDWITENRAAIWAHALRLAEAGEPYHVPEHLKTAVADWTAAYVEDDGWDGPILRWLARVQPKMFTTTELLRDVLQVPVGLHRGKVGAVGKSIAKAGGYRRERFRVNGYQLPFYVRDDVSRDEVKALLDAQDATRVSAGFFANPTFGQA